MISEQKQKNITNGITAPARPKPPPGLLGTALAFGVFVVCLAGLTVTIFLDLLNNYGVSYGPDLPRIPYTSPADLGGSNPLGVNTSLHLETDPTQLDRSLDMIKAGGYGFIRQALPWEYIEPEQGRFEWAKFDNIIEKAAARNLQIIARLDRPPFWARQKEYDRLKIARPKDFSTITGPPENYQDYAAFVAEVARRYKGKLKFYQIWNEPNLANEWNDRRANPAEYVNLLKLAQTSLKQADPNAVVLAAPLSATDQDGPEFNNLNELKYLDQMYRAGAKAYFDILTVQMYGLGYDPSFRFLQPDFRYKDFKRVNLNRAAASREVMLKNGDSAKPVWAAEYGWIAVPPGPYLEAYNDPKQGNQQWGENISEADQARYLVAGLERARKEWPWLGVVNIWFFRPDPPLSARPQDPTNYFALVQANFQPRPAYLKLQGYAAQEYKTAGTGWHPATDPAAVYASTTKTTLASGDKFSFSFAGERAELVLARASDGILKISTDGGNPKELKFSAKTEGETRLTLVEGLRYGPHSVQVSLEGATGGPLVRVVGYYVSRDNQFGWLVLLLYGGLGAGTIGAGAIFGWRSLSSIPWLLRHIWQERSRYAPFGMLIALAIYYLAPPLPLAIAGAVLFFPMALLRPDWAVLLAVMFAPLYLHPRDLRLSQSPLETLHDLIRPRDIHDNRSRLEFSLTEVIIVITMAAWLFQAVWNTAYSGWKIGFKKTFSFLIGPISAIVAGPFALPLIAFFGLACLSLLTPEPLHLKEALREFRLVIVEPLLVYLLAVRFLKGRGGVWKAFDVLIAAGVAIALLGIVQFLFGRDRTVAAEGVSRVVSIYNHPDNLGLFLGRIIPLAASYLLFFGREWTRRRWFYLIALGPLLLALVLSFSRGAWLGTAAALLVMTLMAGSRRGLLIYGAGILVAAATIPFIKLERITSLFNFVGGSNSTRLHVWQAAIQMLRDHPLTGLGLDQFLYKYSLEYVPPEAWLERFTSHPHNLILDYWLRLGIIAPVLIIWLLALFFKTQLQFRLRGKIVHALNSTIQPAGPSPELHVQKQEANNEAGPGKARWERRVLSLGLLGSMTDFTVHGLVDNSYFLVDLAVVFCLSFALVEVLRRDALAEKENNS